MKRTAKDMEALIIQGLRHAVAIDRGEAKPVRERVYSTTARDTKVAPPPAFDAKRVVALRTSLELSQPVFAQVLNVSPKLVQAWEQGARMPNGASQRLLQVAEERGTYLVEKVAHISRDRASPKTREMRHGEEPQTPLRPARSAAAKSKRG